MTTTQILKRLFGNTEIHVGSIEGVVAPIPGTDTPEGRAQLAKFSDKLRRQALATSQDAHVNA